MKKDTQEKLAASLTAKTTELLPFLPYLLQDFWELGSDPGVIAGLIEKHAGVSEDTKVLDLACGKGAVSVKVAQKLRVRVKGVDIIPAFTEFAAQKAMEYGVGDLCDFMVGDINDAVKTEKNYDIVILGAVGDVLGRPAQTLNSLGATIKQGGYILIDECYLPDEGDQQNVLYDNYQFLTKAQWDHLFRESGLELTEAVTDFSSCENLDSVSGMAAITARANELIQKHPDKKDMFEGYIRSQQDEYDDIDNNLVPVVWILKKL